MGLPGQAGAEAVLHLLTGQANPSGKLTETWPMSYDDVISKETFGKKNTEYREGIYVGYRYYDKAGLSVRYPFGYGLSYTSFDYSDLCIENNKVSVCVTNTGALSGKEVVQLYVHAPETSVYRPVKELKRFKKISLAAKESVDVEFELGNDCFEVWKNGWILPSGTYQIQVGTLSKEFTLVKDDACETMKGTWYETLKGMPTRDEWQKLMGYEVPVVKEAVKGEFTWDNTVLEMKETSGLMRFFANIVELFISKQFGWKKDMSNPTYRMMVTSAMDCPIRAMAITVGNIISDTMAEGIVLMGNGHFFKGMAKILKK